MELTQVSLAAAAGRAAQPSIPHLMLLVFIAILEVVCTSLPGYVLARCGLFPSRHQKFLAEINVNLFTPCLSMFRCTELRLPNRTGE